VIQSVAVSAERQAVTEGRPITSHAYGYETARPDVQAHVPPTAMRILDLGCSTGALGASLKRRQGALVVGVELDGDYATAAASCLDRVIESDVETFLRNPPTDEAPFDCLIAADVLEHLVDPWTALRRVTELLEPGATVVVSLPNVAHWAGLLRLVRTASWPRDEAGPFDRTHLRWFTRDDAVALLRQAGVEPDVVEPRYWTTGWRLELCKLLDATPLSRFMAVQYLLSGVTRRPD
jgi:2-polyprenyl-3-methyl-5-hydroxy-6-metoxy-1,4-benzoquinol methylase